MTQKRQPWMKLYPADFRSDPKVKMCSRAARSVWFDLMGIMHESEPYGFLLVDGKQPTLKQLSSMIGDSPRELDKLRLELENNGVYSRVGDANLDPDLAELIPPGVPDRTIFSRRMVRDAAKSAKFKKYGEQGGNPDLLGDSPRPTHRVKPQSPESRSQRKNSVKLRNLTAADAAPAEPVNQPGPEPGIIERAVARIDPASDPPAPDIDPRPEAIPLFMRQPEGGDWAKLLFDAGSEYLLAATGRRPAQCRELIGGFLKLAGEPGKPQDHRRVFQVLADAQAQAIADPIGWAVATLGGRKNGHDGPDPARPTETTVGGIRTAYQDAVEAWREAGMDPAAKPAPPAPAAP